MNRFIQQRLFDHIAAKVARFYLVDDPDVAQRFLEEVARAYQRDYADHDLEGQLARAGEEALTVLDTLKIDESLGGPLLESFAYFVKNFDEKGHRLSIFKRFGGTHWHYERVPISDLVTAFRLRFAKYAAMGKMGILREEWTGSEPLGP